MASLHTLNTTGNMSAALTSAGPNQADRYAARGASPEFVKLVALGNKAFGSAMEHITACVFGCENVPDSQGQTGWDLCRGDARIELKSSRIWGGSAADSWTWQHIIPDHEWSYLMCAAVDIDKIRYFVISKPQVVHLVATGIVTQQGGGGGQGCWIQNFGRAAFGSIYQFQPEESGISLPDQLDNFIAHNPSSPEPIACEIINKATADARAAKVKATADARAAKVKATADARAAKVKATADARAAKNKATADTRAAKNKATADARAAKNKAAVR